MSERAFPERNVLTYRGKPVSNLTESRSNGLHSSVESESLVRSPGGHSEYPRVEAPFIAATMQSLIDQLPEQIALLDEQFNILVVNRSWTDALLPGGG